MRKTIVGWKNLLYCNKENKGKFASYIFNKYKDDPNYKDNKDEFNEKIEKELEENTQVQNLIEDDGIFLGNNQMHNACLDICKNLQKYLFNIWTTEKYNEKYGDICFYIKGSTAINKFIEKHKLIIELIIELKDIIKQSDIDINLCILFKDNIEQKDRETANYLLCNLVFDFLNNIKNTESLFKILTLDKYNKLINKTNKNMLQEYAEKNNYYIHDLQKLTMLFTNNSFSYVLNKINNMEQKKYVASEYTYWRAVINNTIDDFILVRLVLNVMTNKYNRRTK